MHSTAAEQRIFNGNTESLFSLH